MLWLSRQLWGMSLWNLHQDKETLEPEITGFMDGRKKVEAAFQHGFITLGQLSSGTCLCLLVCSFSKHSVLI